MVDQSIQEYLTEYLELHPDVLDSVLSKALNAFKVVSHPHTHILSNLQLFFNFLLLLTGVLGFLFIYF